MNARVSTPGRPAAVAIAATIACLIAACRQDASRAAEAETEPAAAMSAAQPASVDTPPGAPSEAATSDTGAGVPADSAKPRAATGEASGDVVNGWKQYEVNCARCHGQDALGSALAPDLRKSVSALGHAGFVQVVKEGRPANGMPGFATQLDDAQVNDIVAYLAARASGKLGPGRPGG